MTKKSKTNGLKPDILSKAVSSSCPWRRLHGRQRESFQLNHLVHLSSLCKVEWGDLAVCLSLSACPSYSPPPGRCTSLLWLNRLSRDPINHHLHSCPVRSPFSTATSSDMYTLLFTHALHAILRPHLPFILHHLISQHTDAHTLRHPWTLFPRHLIRKDQTAITASASQFSFPFLSLSGWPAWSATTC